MNIQSNKFIALLAFMVLSTSFFLHIPRVEAGFSSTGGSAGQSYAFTQTAGSNRIVVVSISWESNGNQTDTVNTITYGGNAPSGSTAMAMNADGQPVTQYVVNYFWLESALPADGSRTATYTINNPGGGNQGFYTQVTQFNNMAQVVPSGSATNSEGDQSVDVIVSTAGSSVIMSVVHNTGAVDATVGGSFASTDEKWDVDTGDTRALGAILDSPSVGTFTGSWTGTVSRPATTVSVLQPLTGIHLTGFDSSASSANSGTDTIAVPSGTTVAVVYWSGWLATHTLNMSSLTIGGQSMTILQNGTTNTPTDAFTGGGVAILINPPTGNQTFAWDWTGSNTMDEGALFQQSFFATSIAPQSNSDVLVDSDLTQWTGEADGSVVLDSVIGGYVQGMVESYSCSLAPVGAPIGSNQTVDINDLTNNCEGQDIAHEDPVNTTSTTFSGHGDYGLIAAISLKDIAPLISQPLIIFDEE